MTVSMVSSLPSVLKEWTRRAFSPKWLLLTNTVGGTAFLAAGDFAHQHVVSTVEGRPLATDWNRTMRVVVVSLLFLSPVNHFYYLWLDGFITRGSHGRKVMKKLAIDTATGPVFASTYVVGINVMEGKTVREGWSEYKQKIVHFLALDALLWVPLQTVNFWFVPSNLRVLFVTTATLLDSFFFAHIKQLAGGTEGTVTESTGSQK